MLKFTQMELDRCFSQRKNSEWVNNSHRNGQFLLLLKNQHLVNSDTFQPVFLGWEQVLELGLTEHPRYLLGANESQNIFALDLTERETLSSSIPQPLETEKQIWVELRQIAPNLDNQTASLLMLARGLLHWHRHSQFCGACGEETETYDLGHSRQCLNASCEYQVFPRTDSAVIMVVKRIFSDGIERVLLGRQSSWPEGMYSCLAGFVDQGETLEQTVKREVKEESGIEIGAVHYIASQPWLLPSSLMLGFFAEATSEEIQVDKDELADAKWFTREEVKTFGEVSSANEHDGTECYKLPSKISISRLLIEMWLDQA
ncbi:NAD(+) diphosphatase [Vibrio sp. SS-MA-C1-2]|uniref:NAD(+) diphosphatase n=1 Tax=Vibrio sp. SS-MA-C1-2 TaxID=2908646 RepID=UPI001F40CECF|nr:NAD(+) diphosphatase [Vibrio sp. SS-MA-C1-2]UJF19954.1 NAD(+) diphosphatase [Vibrio sp. SS-MA-C1-2]